jgi:hypothetical protein
MSDPGHRHALGCDADRNSRHNGVRDVLQAYTREAGMTTLKEQSYRQLAGLTGAPYTRYDDVESRDEKDDSDDEDEAPVGVTAGPDATNVERKNRERPCDIVILHRSSDAPSTVTAYDVTMRLPDSKEGQQGMHPRGECEPDWQRALTRGREEKEKRRGKVEELRAAYEPLVFSTNGRPDERTVHVLANLAKDWALAHACSEGHATRNLRERISCVTHRWNGQILTKLCGATVERGSA